MKVISIVNQKGGVGKTTLSFNLSHLLGDAGIRILTIDLDPQSNLTLSVLGEIPDKGTSYDMLMEGSLPLRKVDSFDFIPASLELFMAEPRLHSAIAKEFRLSKALEKLSDEYDVVLVDTPPNLGILTINALTASNGIIIPVEMGLYSLAGLKHLMEVLDEIKEYLHREIEIVGVVPTMYDRRVALHQEVLEELERMSFKVFPPVFRRSAFQYSNASRQPVHKENIDKETLGNLKTLAEEVVKWAGKRVS